MRAEAGAGGVAAGGGASSVPSAVPSQITAPMPEAPAIPAAATLLRMPPRPNGEVCSPISYSGELILLRDLGDELGIVVAPRVLRVEARLIGEQDQQPRLEHDRHLRCQEVVVAEGDLVGGSRVVLVHHRDDAPVEQPAERLARVQIVGPQLEVGGGEQDLRRTDVPLRKPLLVGPEEAPLPDGRGRLELVDRGRPARAAPSTRMPRAIAPEVTMTTFSPPPCSSATWAQTRSSTSLRSAP